MRATNCPPFARGPWPLGLLVLLVTGGCVESPSTEPDGSAGADGAGNGGNDSGGDPVAGGSGGVSEAQAAERAALDEQYEEINELASDLTCDHNDQCKYVGLGEKPCGGPWSFLVYSTKSTDEEALLELTTELVEDETNYNGRWGVRSNCNSPIRYAVECTSGACQQTETIDK